MKETDRQKDRTVEEIADEIHEQMRNINRNLSKIGKYRNAVFAMWIVFVAVFCIAFACGISVLTKLGAK